MEAPSSNVPHYLKTKVHTTSTKPLVVFSALAPSSGLPSALLEPGVARLEESNGNVHSQSDRHISYPNPVLRTGEHGQYSRDSTGHLRGAPASHSRPESGLGQSWRLGADRGAAPGHIWVHCSSPVVPE